MLPPLTSKLPSMSCRVQFTALSASAELRRGGGGATITTGSSPSARHPRRPVPVSILSGSSAHAMQPGKPCYSRRSRSDPNTCARGCLSRA
eukprot:scaffold81370_cov32-Phaeocystis_antarctica.AAC.1